VPKQEIVDNGYDLSINKYKKVEYVAVEYPPTAEIIQEIEQIEAEISVQMAELKKLLGL
jgi:type I restriction enzyme M protein